MSAIVEVETWTVADGSEADHHEMIRKWFDFLRTHHAELFPEWKSVRYYRELGTDRRTPTGRYIMLFEFRSVAGRDAYKERRKDWSGPYAAYREVDPYQFFNHDAVTLEFWEPREPDQWLEFD
ncbi:hypothetical protein [Phytoactinopolyspora limicola]|uniref:hypothetical protein n=1 Tax=Phytoactinopolyspora limicola TaxID=2715536 RepID=UPI001409EA7C|nr:hypothetical protein [Phytoactinopolyspora limicola]